MKKVITYGSFDLFHEGHYRLLQRAKALGDYLIVGVTTQQYDESRGKLNIVDSLVERIENVKKSGFADEIIVEDHSGQKVEDIQKYGIDIFAIGSDWTGAFDYLKDFCEVVYLERTKNISSTLLRERQHPIIRIGIIGTGRIAERFIPEAKYVSGVTVSSVYNPHKQRAKEFAKKFDLNYCMDNIEEFWKAIDAVYIASPHETHYEYAKMALENHKHVLCEKPMALKRAHAEELFNIAAQNNCVLLEAIKTAYCPGFAQLVGIVKSGAIGRICDVEACFTRLTPEGIREKEDMDYGGGFMEFGSHTMLPIFKLMGTNYKEVNFQSILDEKGIDQYTKTTFLFEKGMALSKSGVGVKSEGQLIVSGTKGYILAESPWWLTKSFEVRYEDPTKRDKYYVNFLGDGLRYEISDFAYMINGHEGRSFKFTKEESIAMAEVMELFLQKRKSERRVRNKNVQVKIWANGGCSYCFPGNTRKAIETACELTGLTGIELKIGVIKNNEPVVISNEGSDCTLKEALELMTPYCRKKGLLVSLRLEEDCFSELEAIERITDLIEGIGLKPYTVYSSSSVKVLDSLKNLDEDICIIEQSSNEFERFYMDEAPVYGESSPQKLVELNYYKSKGITDFITNIPEEYL